MVALPLMFTVVVYVSLHRHLTLDNAKPILLPSGDP